MSAFPFPSPLSTSLPLPPIRSSTSVLIWSETPLLALKSSELPSLAAPSIEAFTASERPS